MKSWKLHGSLAFALALTLCLSLAACGGSGGGGTPESFEGMVKNEEDMAYYNQYFGTWAGEDGSQLIVGLNDSGETRFALYDSDEELTASGYVQFVQKYGADYFYNEHDGWAHHCWMDEDGALHIDSLGVFSEAPMGEEMSEDDCEALRGVWFLDGAADAVSILEIDGYGGWALYERISDDGELNELDWGILQVNARGDHQYFAISNEFDDVSYAIHVVEPGAMYWGIDNDYYVNLT